jgi:hypothetical protein
MTNAKKDFEARREQSADKNTWPKWAKKSDHDRPERYETSMHYEIACDVAEAFEQGYTAGAQDPLITDIVKAAKFSIQNLCDDPTCVCPSGELTRAILEYESAIKGGAE